MQRRGRKRKRTVVLEEIRRAVPSVRTVLWREQIEHLLARTRVLSVLSNGELEHVLLGNCDVMDEAKSMRAKSER
jgi:hypothetical protein